MDEHVWNPTVNNRDGFPDGKVADLFLGEVTAEAKTHKISCRINNLRRGWDVDRGARQEVPASGDRDRPADYSADPIVDSREVNGRKTDGSTPQSGLWC